MKLFHKDYIELRKPKGKYEEEFFEEVKRVLKQYNLSYFTGYRWLREGRIPHQYHRKHEYTIMGKSLREFRKKSLRVTVKDVVVMYQLHYKTNISHTTIFMYESGYIPKRKPSKNFINLINLYRSKARLDVNPVP
jgi:hypothetical protein